MKVYDWTLDNSFWLAYRWRHRDEYRRWWWGWWK